MRQKAIDDDDMVRYLTESVLLDWEEGYTYDAMIENPHASVSTTQAIYERRTVRGNIGAQDDQLLCLRIEAKRSVDDAEGVESSGSNWQWTMQ